jgi:glucose/arabinose dehydrogenase
VTWATDASIRVETVPDSLVTVDTLARGLEVPWAGVFTTGGDFLFTERNGRVRLMRGDSLVPQPVISLEIRPFDDNWRPENGLTGIALAPDFDSSGHIFVLAAYEKERGGLPRRLLTRVVNRFKDLFQTPIWAFENRLLRLRLDADVAQLDTVLLSKMPTNHYHAGGFVQSGPDGMLYVSVGDGTYPRVAQNQKVLAGKILRIKPDGSVPDDNPVPGSPVSASGLRNSQGMALHRESGSVFLLDHGPTGMERERLRVGNDELNVLVPGGNYGWPVEGGSWGRGEHLQPVRVWTESIAPSGLISLPSGDPNRAELIISSLRWQSLRWLTLQRIGGVWQLVRERELLRNVFGRVRLLALSPDGSVLVGTSNRDGRGSPKAEDDLVVRITIDLRAP